jgi:alanine dehydrogenase
VTLPYALKIANRGLKKAISDDPALAKGVNTIAGKIVHETVAQSLELDYTPLNQVV